MKVKIRITVITAMTLGYVINEDDQVSGSKWNSHQRRDNTSQDHGWFIGTAPGSQVKTYHTGDKRVLSLTNRA